MGLVRKLVWRVKLRAFKILGVITRPRIERDHRWQPETLDNEGERHPGYVI